MGCKQGTWLGILTTDLRILTGGPGRTGPTVSRKDPQRNDGGDWFNHFGIQNAHQRDRLIVQALFTFAPDKEGPAWPNWFWSSLPLNWFLQDFPDNISTLATQLECHAPERLPNCIWFPGLYLFFSYPGRKEHSWNVLNITLLICPYPDWTLHIAVQYFFHVWVSSSWANN